MDETRNNYSLMTIEDLQEMLGYSELKYASKWCIINEVPIIKLGKKRYVHAWMFEIALLREIKKESTLSGMDGNEIVNAMLNDDKVRLAELMNVPLEERLTLSSKKAKKEVTVEDIFNKYKKVG